jgi:cell division septation protein DedD
LVSELPEDVAGQIAVAARAPPEPAAPLPTAPADDGAEAAGVSADAAAVSGAAPAVPGAVPLAQRCIGVGPFRELSQAATAAGSLRTAGYTPTQRVAEGDVWIGYWVFIQAIPTEAEANAILERVRAQGIADSYVIPNSDSGNLVSLGVFTEISGVTQRRDEVRALGYEPTVIDRTRRATVYWVDVLLNPAQTLDLDALQTPGRILRLEQRPCDAPAR